MLLALAGWPPMVARAATAAAQPDGCIAGLPPELASQLQPLIQALGEASGQALGCDSAAASDASAQSPPSQKQQDLRLIAEALALLAMADPGYGYSAPGYGSSAPGYGKAPAPPPTVPAPAAAVPPGDAQASATCGSPPDSVPSGGEKPMTN